MKLRMRIILTFFALACVASFIIGYFNIKKEKEKRILAAKENLQTIASGAMGRLDDELDKMKATTDQILANIEVLAALHRLGEEGESRTKKYDRSDESIIKSSVATAYNYDNFYRVLVFNDSRYLVSSASKDNFIVNANLNIDSLEWIDILRKTKGKPVLLKLHKDEWVQEDRAKKVFSYVRKIQGDNMGYIEVQQTKEHLESLLATENSKVYFWVLDSDGETFYRNIKGDTALYLSFFNKADGFYHGSKGIKGQQILLVSSKKSKLRFMAVIDKTSRSEEMDTTYMSAILLPLIFLVASLVFSIWISNLLSTPIRKLRKQMENTDITNMTSPVKFETTDEDVKALASAYENLMLRLNDARQKEKKLSLLQLKAQFDTLQAQVNPHFLYNVLNVIAMRGMENNDEKICEICGRLAAILRYSTNTKERTVSLSDEIKHLEDYLYLLKVRFEDRLQTKISIEKGMEGIKVPKILIQQFVENSIEHGFNLNAVTMCIEVIAKRREDAWDLIIKDNGSGISETKKREILSETEIIKNRIKDQDSNLEFDIGGMGIPNTYGRFYMMYGEDTFFQILNREESGTCIVIGAKSRKGVI